MFTYSALVFVLITIIFQFYFRQAQNYKWKAISIKERLKLRNEIQESWREGVCATYRRDMDKLLIAKHARLAHNQIGYIHIEVPSLVRWIAWADDGVQKILEDAVSSLAVDELRKVLA